MHPTAMQNCKDFFDCYSPAIRSEGRVSVIDIGAQNVNGSLKEVCPASHSYLGVDFVAGAGVDVVLDDPYQLPFPTASADIILSSSCFEHSEMFWILFIEILRVLKPMGLFYLNVPSNGDFHRWPVDCWRFYPDSGRALVTWAHRNGISAALLESFTTVQIGDQWNDFVAVFLKEEAYVHDYPNRILSTKSGYNNALLYGQEDLLKPSAMPEDRKKMAVISQIIGNHIKLD